MVCLSSEDREWVEARITKTKTLIVAYEDALLALAGGAQMYSLDTGQTRQTVTKANVASMKSILTELEERLSMLQGRLNGTNTIHVVPRF